MTGETGYSVARGRTSRTGTRPQKPGAPTSRTGLAPSALRVSGEIGIVKDLRLNGVTSIVEVRWIELGIRVKNS